MRRFNGHTTGSRETKSAINVLGRKVLVKIMVWIAGYPKRPVPLVNRKSTTTTDVKQTAVTKCSRKIYPLDKCLTDVLLSGYPRGGKCPIQTVVQLAPKVMHVDQA